MANQTTDPQAPLRRPGRPPSSDIDQREHLLDSALLSFAEQGIAATSLRQLARQAGVTPAMLNYYFGTKERLVRAVVDERLMPVITEQKSRMAIAGDSGAAAIALSFVQSLHKTILNHPWLPSLWVREVLSEGGQLRDVFSQRIAPEIALPLADRFAAGQRDGEINPDVDPRLLFVSLISLTMLPFAAQPIWRRAFDAADIGTDTMLEHTLALLTGGLES